ncbi:unnamed protein product [Urochloa decumbens]|uniref:Uncharacterized protein n=1 Tax=Urochloa decumbens TaxID=240449 RepID=A0ABC9FEH6_9POAL
MAFGALVASRLARSSRTLASAVAQAPMAQRMAPPLLSRLGAVARALSTKPAAAYVIGIAQRIPVFPPWRERCTPRVIDNTEGARTTPSIVAKNQNGDLLIGITASRQAVTNAQNNVRGSKRLIGRTFDDPQTQKELNMVPYKIVRAPNGDAWVEMGGQKYSPS